MGKIKHSQKNGKTHILTEREVAYVKILNYALMTSTFKDKCISGYFYYVCTSRFGYTEDQSLIFEIDLDSDKNELLVKEIPTELVEQALQK
jgi:hypothetical protein